MRHRPFELNPGLPPEGVPVAGFLEARFGDVGALREAQARLTAMGRELGLAYDSRKQVAVRALYRAYFERGLDVTDPAMIVEVVSASTGEDAGQVQARLESATDAVDAAFALGRELGVSAVPTFVADAGAVVDPEVGLSSAAVAVQGAQPIEVLVQVLDEARRRAGA